MPKVGDKEFAYNQKGMAEAKEYAREVGQDIPTYDAGGRVERIQGYEKGGKVTKKDVAKRTMAKKEAEYRMKKVIERSGGPDLGAPGHVTETVKAKRKMAEAKKYAREVSEMSFAKFMEGKGQRKEKSFKWNGKTRVKKKNKLQKTNG